MKKSHTKFSKKHYKSLKKTYFYPHENKLIRQFNKRQYMNVHHYTTYNLWANRRMIDMLTTLSEAEMEQEIVSSFPSVKTTLLHIWDAEVIWLKRLQGESLDYWPAFNFKGTQADLFRELLSVSGEFCQYTEALTNPDAGYTFKTTKGTDYTMKKSDTIHHCMNHSTFHRGQLVTMLRQLGRTDLVSTDFITYLRESAQTSNS